MTSIYNKVYISSLNATQTSFFPPILKKASDFIFSFPQTRKIISTVLTSGTFTIDASTSFTCQSSWNVETRVLSISKDEIEKPHNTVHKIASHLIFELFNAVKSPLFKLLKQNVLDRKIDKQTFVTETEKIEFESQKESKKVLKQIVKVAHLSRQIFQQDLSGFANFDLHYRYQQLVGHSTRYEKYFDQLTCNQIPSPIQGAWKVLPRDVLKPVFKQLLYLKNLNVTRKNDETTQKKIGHLLNEYLTKLSSIDSESDSVLLSFTELFRWDTLFDYLFLFRHPSNKIPPATNKKAVSNKKNFQTILDNQKLLILRTITPINSISNHKRAASLSKMGSLLNVYLNEYVRADSCANHFFLRLRKRLTWSEIFNSVVTERVGIQNSST